MNYEEFSWESPRMQKARRAWQVIIYVPGFFALIAFAVPISSSSAHMTIFGDRTPLQYLVGTLAASITLLAWLTRYLQFGVLSPLPYKLFRTRRWYGVTLPENTKDLVGDMPGNVSAERDTFPSPARPSAEGSTSSFDRTFNRITQEISALSRRNNLNLVFGFAAALGGIILIAISIYGGENHPKTMDEFFMQFGPRLSLAVFVEVFAYFFLGLYKQGLMEIKYYQNELTNIECKSIALNESKSELLATTRAEVIKQISLTERNGILEKDQTTAPIQMAKFEHEAHTGLLSTLASALRPSSKPSGD